MSKLTENSLRICIIREHKIINNAVKSVTNEIVHSILNFYNDAIINRRSL